MAQGKPNLGHYRNSEYWLTQVRGCKICGSLETARLSRMSADGKIPTSGPDDGPFKPNHYPER